MATYKKIVDVETVAEATENMNMLIEDAGSLKKISMENVGGGNSNFLIIKGTLNEVVPSDTTITPDTFTANMTFEEFYSHIENGTLTGFCMNFYNSGEIIIYQGYRIRPEYYPEYIKLNFLIIDSGELVSLNFNSDNTIEILIAD